jgi:hypothetical protein
MTPVQNLHRIERDCIASSCRFDCHGRARQQAIDNAVNAERDPPICKAAVLQARATNARFEPTLRAAHKGPDLGIATTSPQGAHLRQRAR